MIYPLPDHRSYRDVTHEDTLAKIAKLEQAVNQLQGDMNFTNVANRLNALEAEYKAHQHDYVHFKDIDDLYLPDQTSPPVGHYHGANGDNLTGCEGCQKT